MGINGKEYSRLSSGVEQPGLKYVYLKILPVVNERKEYKNFRASGFLVKTKNSHKGMEEI